MHAAIIEDMGIKCIIRYDAKKMNFKRESIFISAIRSFFKAFSVVIGIAIGMIVVIFGISALSGLSTLKTPEKSELTVSADTNWSRKILADDSPVLLKITIEGVIGTLRLKEQKFRSMLLDSREGILANNRVKGILIYMDTPGGSAIDSSGIYNLLKEYKEKFNLPIYVFVDGLCASGGMYIACAGDQIFASSDSVIGSVGVRLGPTFNFSEAMEKLGVKSLTLTQGKDKDALNPFRPWKEGEDQAWKTVMEASYDIFLEVVSSSRKKLTKEKLKNVYGANIFPATLAENYGYVDNGNATYNGALSALAKAAGVEEGKYQVIEMEPYQSFLSDLAEEKSSLFKGKIHHVFPTGAFTTTEMSGKILYLYQP